MYQNGGLKRSMPCSDLNSMSSIGRFEYGEKSSRKSLLSSKRIRLSDLSFSDLPAKRSSKQSKHSKAATPATDALEKSQPSSFDDVERQIELLESHMMNYSTKATRIHLTTSCAVDMSFGELFSHPLTFKAPKQLGTCHHSVRDVRDVAHVFSRMTTSA